MGRTTHRLIVKYVMVCPYCHKLVQYAFRATSERPLGLLLAQSYAGCCGLMFMCCGCPSRPIRCFCFLCSVIWKRQKKKTNFSTIHPTCVLVLRIFPATPPSQRCSMIHLFAAFNRMHAEHAAAPCCSNLPSDERSWLQPTNNETWSPQISKIKHSTWLITKD